MKRCRFLAILLSSLIALAQGNNETVTLFILGAPSPGETREISPAGVGKDGATTYVIKDFQTVTTTIDGSVIVTPIFTKLDTIQEGGSRLSAYITLISTPYAAQQTCSIRDSSLECVNTIYSSGRAYTTNTITADPYYVTLTFPATSTASSTASGTATSSTPKGAIVGGVVGSLLFVLGLVALLLFCRYRRNRSDAVDRAGRRSFDAPVMEGPLAHVSFVPSTPQNMYQSSVQATQSCTLNPDDESFNPYNIYPESPPESSRMSSSIPGSYGIIAGTQLQPKQASRGGGIASGPSDAGSPLKVTNPSPIVEEPSHPGPIQPSPILDSPARDDLEWRAEVEALKGEVRRLRQLVVPDVAPPQYDG